MVCALPLASARKSPVKSPVAPLLTDELHFINAYFANGHNGTQAYLLTHPGVKYNSAEVGAVRVLRRARVQAEIASRLQHEGGVTKEYVQSSLLKYQSWADAKNDYVAGASIIMDAAKAAGLITEKREVKSVSVEESTAIRDLVRASMRPIPQGSMPPASDSVCVTPSETCAPASTPATGAN